MSLASWWHIPNLRNTFGGYYLPLTGLFGAIPHPSCTLLGHQWVERVPEEPKSGGDSGLLGGVLSGLSVLPHTHQLPHTLSLVSSLIRQQQVPERPCPQSPLATVATRGDPTTPAPLHPLLGPPRPPATQIPQVGAQVQPQLPRPFPLRAKSL